MADSMSDAAMLATVQNAVIALGEITKALGVALPAVQSTATSATGGSASALPSAPAGYITSSLPNGTAIKIPYYLP